MVLSTKRSRTEAFSQTADSFTCQRFFEDLITFNTLSQEKRAILIKNIRFSISGKSQRSEMYRAGAISLLFSALQSSQGIELQRAIIEIIGLLSEEEGANAYLLSPVGLSLIGQFSSSQDINIAKIISKMLAEFALQHTNHSFMISNMMITVYHQLLSLQDSEVKNNVCNVFLELLLNEQNIGINLGAQPLHIFVQYLSVADNLESVYAAQALNHLARFVENNRVLHEAGGIALLVSLLKDECPITKEYAVHALWLIANTGAYHDAMLKLDIIPALLTLVANERPNTSLYASEALLLFSKNKTSLAAIHAANGISILTKYLNQGLHVSNRQNISGTIAPLLEEHEANQEAFQAAGGIPLTLSLLEDENSIIRTNAAYILAYISGNPMTIDTVNEHHGIPTLINCLRNLDPCTSWSVAHMLGVLAKNTDNSHIIREAGGIIACINALEQINDWGQVNLLLARNLIVVLSNLLHDPKSVAILRAHNCKPFIKQLNHPFACTREHSIHILLYLSKSNEYLHKIKQNNGKSAVAGFYWNNKSDQAEVHRTLLEHRLHTCGTQDHPHMLHIPSYNLNIENETLGEGGFGKVYLGNWFSTFRVAIKKARDDKQSQKYIEALRQEAKRHNTLKHSNIVTLYGVSGKGYNYGLVLEYMAEGDLYTKLHQMPKPQSLPSSIAFDIAAGLNYMHQQHMIHCDLKSANILLKTKGNKLVAKISDFGCSELLPSTPGASIRPVKKRGTTSWKAPEILQDNALSKASDVYAFCIILWEIATREKPFFNKPKSEVQQRIIAGERPGNLQEIEPATSKAYVEIIRRGWLGEPSQRISMDEASNELQNININIRPC